MNGPLQKKLRSYLSERSALHAQYLKIKENARDQDLESREDLEALYEYDQLCYSHNAIKAYYDASKRDWDFSDYHPFDLFADLMPKAESKLPIGNLCSRYNGLQVLRRQLKESAGEGGRIANSMMTSSMSPEEMKRKMDEVKAELSLNSNLESTVTFFSDGLLTSPRSKKTKVSNGHEISKEKEPFKAANGDSFGGPHVHQVSQSNQNKTANASHTSGHPKTNQTNNTAAPGEITKAPETIVVRESSGTPQIADTVSKKRKVNGVEATEVTQKGDGGSSSPPTVTAPLGTAVKVSSNLTHVDSPVHKKHKPLVEPEPRTVSSSTPEPSQQILRPSTNLLNKSHFDAPGSSRPINQPLGQNELTKTQKPLATPLRDTSAQSDIAPNSSSKLVFTPNRSNSKAETKSFAVESPANAIKSAEIRNNTPDSSQSSPMPRSPISYKSSFTQLSTWNKDYVRCIVNAAAAHPLTPAKAIQSSLEAKFKVKIRLDEAEMLRSYYGLTESTMDNYAFYIQTFITEAKSIIKTKYLTVPWSQLSKKFTRACGLKLEDWDLKGRYHLYLLHGRVYGNQGEPTSNYQAEVENYRKNAFRRKSSFLKDKSKTSNQVQSTPTPVGFQPSDRKASIFHDSIKAHETPKVLEAPKTAETLKAPEVSKSMEVLKAVELPKAMEFPKAVDAPNSAEVPKVVDAPKSVGVPMASKTAQIPMPPKAPETSPNDDVWTPEVFKALVNAHIYIPPHIPNRMLALVAYIGIKTREKLDVDTVVRKCNSKEFWDAVNEKLSKGVATSSPAQSKIPWQAPDYIRNTLKQIAESAHPDWFYENKLRGKHLSDFWTFARTKCIMSTIEFADGIPCDSNIPQARALRSHVIKLIQLRLLTEEQLKIEEEELKTKIVHMMEYDLFDESQCRFLNEVMLKP